MKNQPFYDCPHFRTCSVNNCPLHPKYPNLPTCPDDPVEKCKAQKPTRTGISEKYPGILKMGGLTVKEYRLKLRRDNRTPEEWEILRERAKKLLYSRATANETEKTYKT